MDQFKAAQNVAVDGPCFVRCILALFMRRWIRQGLLFLLAATRSFAAQQDDTPSFDPLKQLSLEQLTQLEVTSVTKEPVPAFQTPAAIAVLTDADIRRAGARTIPDLLRLMPGIEVAQIHSSEWAIGIRGFQGRLSRSFLVLIDGRSVYTPLFAGVYWEMNDVLIEDIDRIEVIRGPGGTIWGSNAVNGIVNIITKNARETRGMLISAGTGNVEQGFLNWRLGGGNDAFSYRIYGKGFTRGPQQHDDNRNFDDWRKAQAGFRMDWLPGNRDAVTIQGDTYTAEGGHFLRTNFYSPPANPAVEGAKTFNGQNLMAAWRRALPGGSDLQLRTYYDRTERQEINYKEVRHTVDADFLHHIPLGRHDLTWGLGTRISPSRFFQKLETVNFVPQEQTYTIFSGFLQNDTTLVQDRVSVRLGVKLEHTSFENLSYQPSAHLTFTPTPRYTFWGAATRAVRTPSRIEEGFNFTALLAPSPPLFVRLTGDGEFQSETLFSYAAGARMLIRGQALIGASLFHNRYSDLLSVESEPTQIETTPPPPRQVIPLLFRNGVLAQSSGGEVTALWDIAPSVRLRASYSLVNIDGRNKAASNDASTVRQLEGDTPQHKVVGQSAFALPEDFELSLDYRYVSAVPNQLVPGYHTGDIRIARRLGRNLEVEVVGRNLLQPSHVEYGGTPGPLVGIRRSGHITFSWTP